MARIGPLYGELFAVCGNGFLPNLKSVSALIKHNTTSRSSREKVAVWASHASQEIRKVAKQFRELAAYPRKLDTGLRKAWGMRNTNQVGHLRTISLWGQTLEALGVNRLQELWGFKVLSYRALDI